MVVSTALSSRLRSTLGVLPALLVVGVALWETCATHVDANAVPADVAWDRASELVRAQFRPGDLIEFAPDWVDPVGRLHLGELMTIDDAARMDAARYGRIRELSIRGAHGADTAGLTATSAVDADGVTVSLFERTPVTVLADVRTVLPGASTDGGPATLVLAEVGSRRTVASRPRRSGAPIRVTFPALPLGSSLVGYVGLADVFTRRDIRDRARSRSTSPTAGSRSCIPVSTTAGSNSRSRRNRPPTSRSSRARMPRSGKSASPPRRGNESKIQAASARLAPRRDRVRVHDVQPTLGRHRARRDGLYVGRRALRRLVARARDVQPRHRREDDHRDVRRCARRRIELGAPAVDEDRGRLLALAARGQAGDRRRAHRVSRPERARARRARRDGPTR